MDNFDLLLAKNLNGGGGGGADDITPVLTITVVNSTAEGYTIAPNDDAFFKLENNHLTVFGGVDLAVENGESGVFETIVPVQEGMPSIFDPESIFFYGDGVVYNFSNTVNCSVMYDSIVAITDQSQNASCTLTFTLGE